MATRYRQLEAPEAVDTSLLESGGSQAAASLARSLKEFEGILLEPIAKARAAQGEQEGAVAGSSGTPEFRAGLRAQTAYGQAYNNAAMRSYAIKAEADAEDTAARLEVEAQNDPEKFATLFGASRDETIKQAPKEARGTLSMIYAQRMGTGVSRLTRARAVEQNELARKDTVEGVERSVDRIATLRASDDPADYERAEEEQAKLTLMIDGAYNDGTLSSTEALALHKNTQRAVTAQTVSARFRGQLNSPYGDPVGFIEKLKAENVTSEALSPKEEAQLVDGLMADLREHNQLMNAKYNEDNALVKARYEQGDRDATAALFSGELTTGKLRDMVRQQRLDPSRATALGNMLQSGGVAADDPKEAFKVRTNLIDTPDDEIANNSKLTYKTRGDLLLEKRQQEQTWKGTQAAQEGKARIERSLGIVAGTNRAMLSDEENEALDHAMTTWYDKVDSLPPGERQKQVISIAEEVAGTSIRKNKSVQAQSMRNAKQSYMERNKGMLSQGENTKKKFEARVQKFDADIAELEAEAARK